MAHCCPTNIGPMVGCSYQPTGKMITLPSGVKAYVAGSGAGHKKGLLATYDIFGFHATTQQTCDILSKSGYVVIMPDFFDGKPWPMEPWPPSDFQPLVSWVSEVGTYATLRPIFLEAAAYLTSKEMISKENIGGVGFCWGAKPMFAAQKEGLLKAIAAPHPSFLDENDALCATAPVCLLPTKDDPPMKDIENALKSNQFGGNNVFQRFDDVHHGFMAARGDWSDPVQGENATKALQILLKFFADTL